jgi:hypothetical protein
MLKARTIVAAVVAVGLVLTASPASAHTKAKPKTKVTVTVTNTAMDTVISWKYSNKAPKSQRLEVIAPDGLLHSMVYKLDSSSRRFVFTNLTGGVQYRFVISGKSPSARGAVDVIAPTREGTSTPQPSQSPTANTKADAPVGVQVVAEDSAALLSWQPVSGATGYRVERKSPGGEFFAVGTPPTAPFRATFLSNGQSYEFRIAAVTTTGVGNFSAPVTVVPAAVTPTPTPTPTPSPTPTPTPSPTPTTTPAVTTPQAPTGLVVTGEAELGKVQLNWKAPGSGPAPEKYMIEITDGKGPFVLAGYVPASGTAVNMASLTPGVFYSFRVYSVVGVQNSTPSVTATITVANVPSAPRSLNVIPEAGKATLSWVAPEFTYNTPVTGYKIEISRDGSTWYLLGDNQPTLSVIAAGLDAKTKYYFRVAAKNQLGLGAWTATISVTTP